MYFVHEPLIHFTQSKLRWSEKADLQYFYVQSMGGPRPVSRKYSPYIQVQSVCLRGSMKKRQTRLHQAQKPRSLVKGISPAVYIAKARTPYTHCHFRKSHTLLLYLATYFQDFWIWVFLSK